LNLLHVSIAKCLHFVMSSMKQNKKNAKKLSRMHSMDWTLSLKFLAAANKY